MKFSLNKIWIGFLIAILAPFTTLIIVYNTKTDTKTFFEFIDYLKMMDKGYGTNSLLQILSICAIPNLFFFFVFIWRNYLAAARGALIATILYAVFVIILNYAL